MRKQQQSQDIYAEIESWNKLESERMKIRRRREALESRIEMRYQSNDHLLLFRRNFYEKQYESVLNSQKQSRERNVQILTSIEETVGYIETMDKENILRTQVQLDVAKTEFLTSVQQYMTDMKLYQKKQHLLKLKKTELEIEEINKKMQQEREEWAEEQLLKESLSEKAKILYLTKEVAKKEAIERNVLREVYIDEERTTESTIAASSEPVLSAIADMKRKKLEELSQRRKNTYMNQVQELYSDSKILDAMDESNSKLLSKSLTIQDQDKRISVRTETRTISESRTAALNTILDDNQYYDEICIKKDASAKARTFSELDVNRRKKIATSTQSNRYQSIDTPPQGSVTTPTELAPTEAIQQQFAESKIDNILPRSTQALTTLSKEEHQKADINAVQSPEDRHRISRLDTGSKQSDIVHSIGNTTDIRASISQVNRTPSKTQTDTFSIDSTPEAEISSNNSLTKSITTSNQHTPEPDHREDTIVPNSSMTERVIEASLLEEKTNKLDETPPKASTIITQDEQKPQGMSNPGPEKKKSGWKAGIKTVGGFLSKMKKTGDKVSSDKVYPEESSDGESLYSNPKQNKLISNVVQGMTHSDIISTFENLSSSIEKDIFALLQEKKKTKFSYLLQQKEGVQEEYKFPYDTLQLEKVEDRIRVIRLYSKSTSSTDSTRLKCLALLDLIKFYPGDLVTSEFYTDFLQDLPPNFDSHGIFEEYFEVVVAEMWSKIIQHLKKLVDADSTKKSSMSQLLAETIYSSNFSKMAKKEEFIQNIKEFLKGCTKSKMPAEQLTVRANIAKTGSVGVLPNRANVIQATPGLQTSSKVQANTRPATASKRGSLLISQSNPFLASTFKRTNFDNSDSDGESALAKYTSRGTSRAKRDDDSDSDF